MIIRTLRLSKVISNSLLPVNSKGDCMYFFVHMSESSREKNLSNCNFLKLSKIDILKISGIIGEINSQISPKRKKVL